MNTPLLLNTQWFEKNIVQHFSPNRLMTLVFLVLLSVFLFGGNGIERRTLDVSETNPARVSISPILNTVP
jgi:ACR3 family arsenite efflux pump ArsB